VAVNTFHSSISHHGHHPPLCVTRVLPAAIKLALPNTPAILDEAGSELTLDMNLMANML
jgi:hypothetical protein